MRIQSPDIAMCLNAGGMNRIDGESETFIVGSLTSNGDAHSGFKDERGLVAIAHSLKANSGRNQIEQTCIPGTVAFAQNQRDEVRLMDVAGALASEPGMKQQSYVAYGLDEEQNAAAELMGTLKAREKGGGFEGSVSCGMAVRRLTPRECERLQGFADDFTAITVKGKPAADGPRYKALGNSMAVPVIAWIGKRIEMIAKKMDVTI